MQIFGNARRWCGPMMFALSLAACANPTKPAAPVIAPVEVPAMVTPGLLEPRRPVPDNGSVGGYIRSLEGALIRCNMDKNEVAKELGG